MRSADGLLYLLSGFQPPSAGTVHLGGVEITRWSPHRRARNGLVRTFQGARVFASLTVRENIEAAGLGLKLSARAARKEANDVLGHLGLLPQAHLPAGALPYGAERRVAVGRALVGSPCFVLLDEPAAGLNEADRTSWSRPDEVHAGSGWAADHRTRHELIMRSASASRCSTTARRWRSARRRS